MAPSLHIAAEEEIVEITFPAVAAYHGQSALAMLALVFQGLRGALPLLSPDRPPPRERLTVTSGHPGPGVRDAFEFVTRCVTRDAYTIDRTLPGGRLNPNAAIAYDFKVGLDGVTAHFTLKSGILPARFFALAQERTDEARWELSALKRGIAARALSLRPEDLFDFTLTGGAA